MGHGPGPFEDAGAVDVVRAQARRVWITSFVLTALTTAAYLLVP